MAYKVKHERKTELQRTVASTSALLLLDQEENEAEMNESDLILEMKTKDFVQFYPNPHLSLSLSILYVLLEIIGIIGNCDLHHLNE